MNTNFQKYLKYKSKYLDLKNELQLQVGGGTAKYDAAIQQFISGNDSEGNRLINIDAVSENLTNVEDQLEFYNYLKKLYNDNQVNETNKAELVSSLNTISQTIESINNDSEQEIQKIQKEILLYKKTLQTQQELIQNLDIEKITIIEKLSKCEKSLSDCEQKLSDSGNVKLAKKVEDVKNEVASILDTPVPNLPVSDFINLNTSGPSGMQEEPQAATILQKNIKLINDLTNEEQIRSFLRNLSISDYENFNLWIPIDERKRTTFTNFLRKYNDILKNKQINWIKFIDFIRDPRNNFIGCTKMTKEIIYDTLNNK